MELYIEEPLAKLTVSLKLKKEQSEILWVFLYFSVGPTPRAISMQKVKSSPLLEVAWNFDMSVREANASIIY